MSKSIWRIVGRFVLLILIQLLVLNHVYLSGFLMIPPMLYLLAILMLPTNMKSIPLLLISFGTGLLMDFMNNMLGFHALACTVVAMMRILFANRILTRGEPVTVSTPSIYSVSPQYFVGYILILSSRFYLVFFIVEVFGFRNFGSLLLATVANTLVTTLLAVLYQFIFLKKETI